MGNEFSKEAQHTAEEDFNLEQQAPIVMAESNSPTPSASDDPPAQGRVPVVVPASPTLKARKKPMPWESDSGTDGSGDSSMERLIKWISRDDHYKKWRTGVGPSGEAITKKALSENFLSELVKAGIDHRKTADIHTKIYELERNFESARGWIVTNKPDQEDSALHDHETRAAVVSLCKYYYRIEPVFGDYFGFSKDLRRSQTPKKKAINATSFKSTRPTSALTPALPASASTAPAPSTTALASLQAMPSQANSNVDLVRFASQLETVLKQHRQQSIPATSSTSSTFTSAPQADPSTQHSPLTLSDSTGTSTTPRLTTISSQPLLSSSSPTAAAQASNATSPIGMHTGSLSYHQPNDAELVYHSIASKERVALERLRLKERKHKDTMEMKKRKLDLQEYQTSKEIEIKKRKATAEILGAHAQLISELRSLGLANSDIIDYMKKAENA
ncbi:hypothetical protein BDB00DRAFT_814930 [Zychaea mexicana]|uniref:uncharacterized protein n=1 Tax=Zychaea mexicana TaxID=64656 RepID=UPI0022FF10C2|nr:uncharacterized protein BDB00DRAFT_814930 [Zychaea mexicana]KAI9495168.1 hypothetical protein BDB00DRAFT_814930 [Zychaea mexicana]